MGNKQKILIIHNYYKIPGGEDTVVANEKKLLEDNGHQVVLYSKNNNDLQKFNVFQKILLPINTIFNFKVYNEVKKIIKEQHIDILHVHNTLNLISPSVYYAGFSCKIPVVQTVHNFRLLCPGATFYRDEHICEDCISKGLKCSIKHKCYRNSTIQTLASALTLKIHRLLGTYKKINYICLTEFNKQKLLELNKCGKTIIDEKKVFVKPNFINSLYDNVILFDKRENQFVFAGRLDKLKGIHILLNAWKNIKDSNLIICGTGPEEEWCKNFIKINGLNNVKMLGFVPNNETIEIIAQSKALILPTQWYEGFPMTIVESFSVGTPVLCSNIGNVSSLIKDNINGMHFIYNSDTSLVNAIKSFGEFSSEDIYYDFLKNYSSTKNYSCLNHIYIKCKF